MARRVKPEHGPAIRAVPFLPTVAGESVQLLTPKQRQQLLAIATKINARKGQIIYREGSIAGSMYICQDGVVKTYRDLPSGTRRVTMFLFGRDIFGLSESGRYVNTAQAVTRVTCYRIPLDVLSAVLQQDAALQYQFLCKVTHELRESQRRAIMMGRRDAAGRIAMFLMMMRKHAPAGTSRDLIPLPMSRSDIAAYLGHSLEAVSRASAQLAKARIIAFPSRSAVKILDLARLEALAADV